MIAILLAAAVAAVDLAARAWAKTRLPPEGIETGPVDLVLGYNSGVAFSLGADAPTAVVVVVTATITAGIAVAAWRVAPWGSRTLRAALALVLGGAVANLLDRCRDGIVTDYLHTGWWPTFNLADVAIVLGGALLVSSMWSREELSPPSVDRSHSAEGSA
ncbi:signal peptidase II [Sporichthya polymorpha]|uniref:signal peptidase II n=1 Tax=Sporichthya polymorpha TaxID=35751 RepID=UPI001B7F9531|nr:signal peptidase II [Sporichthya polymorpha]